VIDIKAINTSYLQMATRYRIIISDGENYMQAMLATQLNDLVEGNQIAAHCVIKLSEFICNQVQARKIVILLAVEVVQGPTGSKIGNPQDVKQAGHSMEASSTALVDPSSHIAGLWDSGTFSDINIRVGDTELALHKNILASCEYFGPRASDKATLSHGRSPHKL
jgi:hypothetical protein